MPRTPHFLHNRGIHETVAEMRKPRTLPFDAWVGVGDIDDANLLKRPESVEWFETVSPPFENNWRNVGGDYPRAAFYMSGDGEVRFRGHVKGGEVGTWIFTLPQGYRPEKNMTFIMPDDAGGYVHIEVTTVGRVYVIAQSTSVVVSA